MIVYTSLLSHLNVYLGNNTDAYNAFEKWFKFIEISDITDVSVPV